MIHEVMSARVSSGLALSLTKVATRDAEHRYAFRFHAPPNLSRALDYCDPEDGEWLWSIGQHKTSGHVFGVTIEEFRWSDEYRELWRRE